MGWRDWPAKALLLSERSWEEKLAECNQSYIFITNKKAQYKAELKSKAVKTESKSTSSQVLGCILACLPTNGGQYIHSKSRGCFC